MKKVVFLWSGMSGYLAACWSELSRLEGIDAYFLVDWHAIDWDESLYREIPNFVRLRTERDQHYLELEKRLRDIAPDVVIVCGWHLANFRRVVPRLSHEGIRFVLAMDTPYRGGVRQHLARYALASYLKHFVMVIVAGERTFQYAKRLGFADHQIKRGVYGADTVAFSRCEGLRAVGPWPREFLFVGRLVESKGLGELARAYQLYREKVQEPWGLTVCGSGEMSGIFSNLRGVKLHGFVQPSRLPEIYSRAGAFILPSRYEPWGVVLAEACSAALPIVCSESVGSAIDLVRPYFNGVVFGIESLSSFLTMLLWIHARSDEELQEMGRRSRLLAEPFSAQNWAKRIRGYVDEAQHYPL